LPDDHEPDHREATDDGPTRFYIRWLADNPLWGGGAIRQAA
jgi:hypothetical protein